MGALELRAHLILKFCNYLLSDRRELVGMDYLLITCTLRYLSRQRIFVDKAETGKAGNLKHGKSSDCKFFNV